MAPLTPDTTGADRREARVEIRRRATLFRLTLSVIDLGRNFSGAVWCGSRRGGGARPRAIRVDSTPDGRAVQDLIVRARFSHCKPAFEAAFSRVEALNRILSDYDSDSELSRLSRSSPMAERPASQRSVVDRAGSFASAVRTDRRRLRRDGRSLRSAVAPRAPQWRDALARAPGRGPRRGRTIKFLKLDNRARTAQLLRPNMRLDLGGIAMGYAVDETLKLLRKRGITPGLVDASGDIAVGDPPPGKQGWTIDVMPLSTDGTPSREEFCWPMPP